jgi:Dolichyl-phosphate-mannose-protein mannosyltransferase
MINSRAIGLDRDARYQTIYFLTFALMLAAGVLYSLHLRRALDSSEAYTALAAYQADYGAIVGKAARFDPGKPPLYQMMLHSISPILGNNEISLRAPSVVFSLLNIAWVVALGGEMFEPEVGLSAACMWAVSPLAILFAGWARVYALTIALFLAQLLTLWRIHGGRAGGAGAVIVCGLLGAAMLYAHLCTALLLAAETTVLAGAAWRGDRARGPWVALALSVACFGPFIPSIAGQTHTIITGHFIDWIGIAHQNTVLHKLIAIFAAIASITVVAFGPRLEADQREPIRWCLGLGLIPVVLLVAGSVAVRPMFAIRYVSPSIVILVLLLARSLASLGVRAFRLSTVGIASFVALLYPCYGWYEPWRDVARVVSAGSPNEPVFFEPIFTDSHDPLADHGQGFPQGFLRPVFDHYFPGPNPRRMVDPSKPAQAQRIIAQAAIEAHGAWLVTTSDEQTARVELPTHCFRIEKKAGSPDGTLLHIIPLDHCAGDQ